jgi:hypothetical protein
MPRIGGSNGWLTCSPDTCSVVVDERAVTQPGFHQGLALHMCLWSTHHLTRGAPRRRTQNGAGPQPTRPTAGRPNHAASTPDTR